MTDMSPRAWLELLVLALIWGASFLSIRFALDEVGPFWVIAWRTTLAALILLAVTRAWRIPLPRGGATWGACLVMGALNNAIPFGLQAFAMLHVESGLVSILNASTAFFGVLIAAAALADERLTARRLAGVLIGMAGVALAIGPGALATLDLTSLAQLAVLGSTLSYALASVWARKRLTHLGPVSAATGMLIGGSAITLPLAVAMEGAPDLSLSATTWAGIAYMVGPATALAYLLYYRVLAMAGSGNLMLVTLLVPPVAITLGALVRAESLTAGDIAGFALIALGMVVLDGRVMRLLRRAPAT